MPVKTVAKRDAYVLFDDDFATGPCGWRGLISGSSAQGVVTPADMPTTGAASLRLGIEDGGASYNPDNYAMAIKRLALPTDPTTGSFAQYIAFEVDLAITSYWNTSQRWSAPRAIDIGLDHGWSTDATGGTVDNRTFIAARYLIIDEPNSNTRVQKFQLRTTPDHGSTSVYTDLLDKNGTAITYPIGYNENKANVFKVKLLADITNHRLVGLAINGKGYGMLDQADSSPTAQNCLYNIGQAWSAPLNQGSVASFYGGLNACVEVYGRTNVGNMAAEVYLSRPRLTIGANA